MFVIIVMVMMMLVIMVVMMMMTMLVIMLVMMMMTLVMRMMMIGCPLFCPFLISKPRFDARAVVVRIQALRSVLSQKASPSQKLFSVRMFTSKKLFFS